MATEIRHAAWQNQRTYAVRLLSGPGPAADIAEGLDELLDAVDFALEWLDRVDPERDRGTRLVILETRAGVTEEVWTYPSERRDEGRGLVELFGYDPVTWKSGVREFSAAERRARLSDRIRPAAGAPPHPRPPLDPPRRPEPEPEPTSEPPRTERAASGHESRAQAPAADAEAIELEPHTGAPPADDTAKLQAVLAVARRSIQVATHDLWDDRLSRSGLLVAIASVWLAIALADLRFLFALLLSAPAVYWRQRSLSKRAADADGGDLF